MAVANKTLVHHCKNAGQLSEEVEGLSLDCWVLEGIVKEAGVWLNSRRITFWEFEFDASFVGEVCWSLFCCEDFWFLCTFVKFELWSIEWCFLLRTLQRCIDLQFSAVCFELK